MSHHRGSIALAVGIDGAGATGYHRVMCRLARFLAAVLVLVFATGTFVQAAAATHSKTNLPMAMSQGMSDHMPGCDGCGDDPDAMACLVACTAPSLALPVRSLALAPMVRMAVLPASSLEPSGEARAPEPYPPRPSVLS